MKVLVCGGRDFDDKELLTKALDNIHAETPISQLIHGGAKGADVLAHWWAKDNSIPTRTFPANWAKYGRGAGPKRNLKMIVEGRPDLIVAFPGGPGTANMKSLGRYAAIKTLEVGPEPFQVPIRTCPRTNTNCFDARCARDWCQREENPLQENPHPNQGTDTCPN